MRKVLARLDHASPTRSADQIIDSVRSEGPTIRMAATPYEGLALTRAFQAISAPQVRSYVIELVETLAARESGHN